MAGCHASAVSFAYSFEAAIWASLPASVVVCVSRCCGRRRQWQETLPDNENQKVLTDWAASSPAASEAWPLTCLLLWKSIWSSSWVDFLLTEDICWLSIRAEGVWMMWGGWVGEEGCQQGWNNMITHLVSSWYLCATTPPAKEAGRRFYLPDYRAGFAKNGQLWKPCLCFPRIGLSFLKMKGIQFNSGLFFLKCFSWDFSPLYATNFHIKLNETFTK